MMGGNQACHLCPGGLPLLWSTSGTWEVRRGGVASSEVEGIFKSLKASQLFHLGSRGKGVTQVLWSKSSCEGYSCKSCSTWEQPRWPQVPALQVGGNWARTHPKSLTNVPTVVSTVMWPLWGYAKGGWKQWKVHTGGGVKLRDPVCWQCRQSGKHSKRHSFLVATIGLGLGLLQRYDLHLENKKCTCLRFSYLHLCYAT